MKRIYVVAAIFLLTALLFTLVFFSLQTTVGKVIDQCVIEGDKFNVRITVRDEEGLLIPVPGAYYSYEYKKVTDTSWQSITTFRHDDQIPAPCNQINPINSSVAYFFIGWIYGVTIDAGNTWFLWNAEKDLEGWQPANYKFIQHIELNQDGKGIMFLRPIRFYSDRLTTDNFGKDWKLPNK